MCLQVNHHCFRKAIGQLCEDKPTEGETQRHGSYKIDFSRHLWKGVGNPPHKQNQVNKKHKGYLQVPNYISNATSEKHKMMTEKNIYHINALSILQIRKPTLRYSQRDGLETFNKSIKKHTHTKNTIF